MENGLGKVPAEIIVIIVLADKLELATGNYSLLVVVDTPCMQTLDVGSKAHIVQCETFYRRLFPWINHVQQQNLYGFTGCLIM